MYNYQSPDIDDMSSFFTCEIDHAIQYTDDAILSAGSKNSYFIGHFFVILCY
jgi:hypothetical protein